MELLNKYKELEKQIHEYFGYVEDWVVIPIEDSTNYYWEIIDEDNNGGVRYSESNSFDDDDYYEDEIYTQRFLPKWIYRAKEYTMICCDTQVDGNKFLRVFDNTKEITG